MSFLLFSDQLWITVGQRDSRTYSVTAVLLSYLIRLYDHIRDITEDLRHCRDALLCSWQQGYYYRCILCGQCKREEALANLDIYLLMERCYFSCSRMKRKYCVHSCGAKYLKNVVGTKLHPIRPASEDGHMHTRRPLSRCPEKGLAARWNPQHSARRCHFPPNVPGAVL